MKRSEFKNHLNRLHQVNFVQANGQPVPSHFHVTEAGLISKHFIDCGGTVRMDQTISFQLWTSHDTEHRLEPSKLLKIISLSEDLFGSEDLEIEVEYQTETVGKYGLSFQDDKFMLTAKQTDCLAKDQCGVPENKQELHIAELATANSCCAPGGKCC